MSFPFEVLSFFSNVIKTIIFPPLLKTFFVFKVLTDWMRAKKDWTSWMLYLVMIVLRKLPRVTKRTPYKGVKRKTNFDKGHY